MGAMPDKATNSCPELCLHLPFRLLLQVDQLSVIDPQLFTSILWKVVFAESEQPRSLGGCQRLRRWYGSSQLTTP